LLPMFSSLSSTHHHTRCSPSDSNLKPSRPLLRYFHRGHINIIAKVIRFTQYDLYRRRTSGPRGFCDLAVGRLRARQARDQDATSAPGGVSECQETVNGPFKLSIVEENDGKRNVSKVEVSLFVFGSEYTDTSHPLIFPL